MIPYLLVFMLGSIVGWCGRHGVDDSTPNAWAFVSLGLVLFWLLAIGLIVLSGILVLLDV